MVMAGTAVNPPGPRRGKSVLQARLISRIPDLETALVPGETVCPRLCPGSGFPFLAPAPYPTQFAHATSSRFQGTRLHAQDQDGRGPEGREAERQLREEADGPPFLPPG